MCQDEWANRVEEMRCRTCFFFVRKGNSSMGRCRRHAPTMNGFPIAFADGWCGDHRLSEKAYESICRQNLPRFASQPEYKDGPDVPPPAGPLGAASSFVNAEGVRGTQVHTNSDDKINISRKSSEEPHLYRKS